MGGGSSMTLNSESESSMIYHKKAKNQGNISPYLEHKYNGKIVGGFPR